MILGYRWARRKCGVWTLPVIGAALLTWMLVALFAGALAYWIMLTCGG